MLTLADTESRLGAARAARRIEEQRRAAGGGIVELRAALGTVIRDILLQFTRGKVDETEGEFERAAEAGDIEACRELVARYRARRAALDRPREVIEAERRAGQEAAKRAYEAAQNARLQEARLQALRAKLAQGWNILAEAETHGRLWFGDDGAVLYSGEPLDEDLLWALDYRAEHVRTSLRQRWQDRVVIAAPQTSKAA